MTIEKDITFIIPHKGRFEMLRETLLSISKQDYDINKLEVIIVSQTPETEKTHLLDNEKLSVHVVLLPESRTISALRNHGVSLANGKYLAFLDADIYLSSNWANVMLETVNEKHNTIIASAIQMCSENASTIEKIRTCLSNIKFDTNVDFLPGRNLFLKKLDFDKIGGFPEHLITCEDYYFTDKANHIGNLYYTSDAQYIHLGEDKNHSEMFRKEIWRGQSNFQSTAGRNITLNELPSLIAPIIVTISLLASIFSILMTHPYVSVFFLACASSILLIYSFRLVIHCKHLILNSPGILMFYLIYFLARTIGTLVGLLRPIGANHS